LTGGVLYRGAFDWGGKKWGHLTRGAFDHTPCGIEEQAHFTVATR